MTVEELLRSVEIDEYIAQYVDGEFEEKNGELWCLSPFKAESTPSFSIRKYPDGGGVFYDFSSGKHGNLVDFVSQYHNVSVGMALNMIRTYAGVSDGEDGDTKRLKATGVAKRFRVSEKASKNASQKPLPETYMDDRFVVDWQKTRSWEEEGISHGAMLHFQVRYDPFDNRLVFPIRDEHGDIINICARTLDPDYKSKKLRKYTYYFSNGSIPAIFGLYENRDAISKKHEIILFEGGKSVFKARDYGFENCGALLTSHLSDYQFGLLVKLGVDVVFALDQDVKVTEDKNIRRLKSYCSVFYISDTSGTLQQKDSPVDQGKEVFQRLYYERRRLR